MFLQGLRRRLGPAAALLSLTVFLSCAGFQGTGQIPLLLSVSEAPGRDVGPWLTPGFAGDSTLTVSWLTERRVDTRLVLSGDGVPTRELVGEPGARLHRLVLSGLRSGQRYRYAADFNGNGCGDDPVFSFTAPDWSGEEATVLVVGDLQPRDELTRRAGRIVARGIAAAGADLVIQLGDVAEIGALPSDWQDSLDILSLYASSVPLAGVIGNHDYYGDPARNFRALFAYPYADSRGAWWSFGAAGAHFAMVDCFEQAGAVSDAQRRWLESDLTAARKSSRYLFLFLHLTPMTTGNSEEATALERWLLPLVDRTGVDAVFFGHDHHYEHWEVVYGKEGLVFDPADRPTGRMVHYFCSGGGGAYPEVDYGILTREPTTFQRRLYDRGSGSWVQRSYVRLPWDSRRYIDHTDDPSFGQLLDGRHYYQLPEASYQGDTDWLGYRYGEQTLHYLLIRIGPQGATVSAHYPSGQLLLGPGGDRPQSFTITSHETR